MILGKTPTSKERIAATTNQGVLLIEAKGEACGAVRKTNQISTKPVLITTQPPHCRGFKFKGKVRRDAKVKVVAKKFGKCVVKVVWFG
jgi:hypothetical protein